MKSVPAPESAPTAEHIGEHTTRTVLFTTPTCPNCKVAIPMLEKAGVVFEKLHATENAELALRLGVKQAPTLVITDGEGSHEIRRRCRNLRVYKKS